MTNTLNLDIVTQEKRLLTLENIVSVSAETVEGEITILPNHVPLLTQLKEGLLRFKTEKGDEQLVAIFGGFLEVDERGNVSILADSAVRAEDIDEAKVKAAEAEAKATLADKSRELEFAEAEAALRKPISLSVPSKKVRVPVIRNLNHLPFVREIGSIKE